MEEQGQYLYIIGVGSSDDWKAGRGSIYHIEARNGEKAIPVFTTPEKGQAYIQANLSQLQAHVDTLENVPASHLTPVTEGRFSIMPYGAEVIAKWAAALGIDYLVRDPQSGSEQEIMRLPK